MSNEDTMRRYLRKVESRWASYNSAMGAKTRFGRLECGHVVMITGPGLQHCSQCEAPDLLARYYADHPEEWSKLESAFRRLRAEFTAKEFFTGEAGESGE